MIGRGTGQTTQQIREVFADLSSGIDVAFICGSRVMCKHASVLAVRMAYPDLGSGQFDLRYSGRRLRFRSVCGPQECLMGWPGKVVFDHAAFWDPRTRRYEGKWRALADGCNVRHGQIEGAAL